MIDPKNTINLTAGIIADPELVANGNIAKFRIAVDYAGSEKGSGISAGYFDVVYYLKDGSDFANKNASFVAGQINGGKMKKGSQIQLVGRLVQERWQQDNQNRSKVVIAAESITYAGSAYQKKDDASSTSAPKTATSNNVPDEF
ncbi:Single-stranded DNA-binding protein [uncultured Caudovirales phage]|uniref:Single-stranded DNA-binding protein n=1 Tax=uncultured Caudovirales phage TaxID=2100421 RepID=A0A6J5MAH5_9CAUD|nr:Single-stranded DNA-binding protein [uncultured Caudovirales phage]CAB4163001.1 Single-stranded DNA-binding protein [uncultured Caudovirales phage]